MPIVRVGSWGDHLQPWHIELTQWAATRNVWFEKGRVYSKPVGPSGASSAAVSCWSYATDCWRHVNQTLTPTLPMPTEIAEEVKASAWAGCEERRGWPMRCASCVIYAPMAKEGPVYAVLGGAVYDGLPGGGGTGTAVVRGRTTAAVSQSTSAIQELRVIPYTPIWLGLVVNTLLFGAAWFLGMNFLGWAWRRVRRKKGHCRKCGYDLRGLVGGVCPECGTAVGTTTAASV